MQYKLLASDFDNTLVPFGEQPAPPGGGQGREKTAGRRGKIRAQHRPRRWSPSTGKEQLGGIRFDYAITCNGACVVDKNGAIVAEHPMTNEEMYALVDFCEDYNYPLQFNFRDAYYVYCEYDDPPQATTPR